MVREEIKTATRLQRKPEVPQDDRTPARDDAADWLEKHVVEEDRWADVSLAQLGEESDWTRQHLSTVLDLYFEPVEEVPESILEAYRKGYRDGFQDGLEIDL